MSEALPTLVFATGNPAKLNQLRYLVAHHDLAVTVLAAGELWGDAGRYEELGETPAEIAVAGAVVVAARLGRPVLTEDSVFAVDALGGRPGLTAGAYLKTHGRAGILRALRGREDRRASIASAVALAEPGREVLFWSRTIPGHVALRERWTPGLPDWVAPSPQAPLGGGYNAIFVPAGETRTLAEIPPAEGLDVGYREPLFFAALSHFLNAWQTPHGPRHTAAL